MTKKRKERPVSIKALPEWKSANSIKNIPLDKAHTWLEERFVPLLMGYFHFSSKGRYKVICKNDDEGFTVQIKLFW